MKSGNPLKKLQFFLFGLVLVSLSAVAATGERPSFKMHLRLWPDHHNQDTLSEQLIHALKQYPHFCDEVWFCTEDLFESPEKHEQSALRMGRMAQKMRQMGIVPSIQLVALGHPESAPKPKPAEMKWGTAVGAYGQVTYAQNCPRQHDYLLFLEQVFAPYARECQPRSVWVDDDLRLTMHHPAPEICYCDTCLKIFNKTYHHDYSRAALISAMAHNVGNGSLRKEWIAFSQESLAGVGAAIARGVHGASPQTKMGLQHVNFHRAFLEGYDWNPIFRAYEQETGLIPVSRPGHGYYNDHGPRGMLEKGLDMARQIRRLPSNVTEIAPEIEGHLHKASGKSPRSLVIETMYYLSMGATQMSYAIICGNQEPMQWYADHYFRELQNWHRFAEDYANFNWGSFPGGIDPYLSPNLPYRDLGNDEGELAWASTPSGTAIYGLAPLGFPFCPDGVKPAVLMMDHAGTYALSNEELRQLINQHGLVVDAMTWNVLAERKLTEPFADVTPSWMKHAKYYESPSGKRIAVASSYSSDINGTQRLQLLRAMDWASGSHLPVLLESMAQVAIVPRIMPDGKLRSVALLNCSISDEASYTLRLRPSDDAALNKRLTFTWKKNGCKPRKLKPSFEGTDVILTVPQLEGYNFGWIAVE